MIMANWMRIYVSSQAKLKERKTMMAQRRLDLEILEGSKMANTLQEINISQLGKRKIIFKYALSGGYVNSLEGIFLSTK